MVSLRWFREVRGRGRKGRSRVQRRAGALDTLNQIREVYEIRGGCRLWELMGCRRHPPHVRVPLILADLALASGVTPARPLISLPDFLSFRFFFSSRIPPWPYPPGRGFSWWSRDSLPPIDTRVYTHFTWVRSVNSEIFFSLSLCLDMWVQYINWIHKCALIYQCLIIMIKKDNFILKMTPYYEIVLFSNILEIFRMRIKFTLQDFKL